MEAQDPQAGVPPEEAGAAVQQNLQSVLGQLYGLTQPLHMLKGADAPQLHPKCTLNAP